MVNIIFELYKFEPIELARYKSDLYYTTLLKKFLCLFALEKKWLNITLEAKWMNMANNHIFSNSCSWNFFIIIFSKAKYSGLFYNYKGGWYCEVLFGCWLALDLVPMVGLLGLEPKDNHNSISIANHQQLDRT